MKKAIVCVLLVGVLATLFGGCGKNQTPANTAGTKENTIVSAEIEKCKTELEKVKPVDEVKSPEEFLKEYKALKDVIVRAYALKKQYPDSVEVLSLCTQIIQKDVEWGNKGMEYINSEDVTVEFLDELIAALEEIQAAMEEEPK